MQFARKSRDRKGKREEKRNVLSEERDRGGGARGRTTRERDSGKPGASGNSRKPTGKEKSRSKKRRSSRREKKSSDKDRKSSSKDRQSSGKHRSSRREQPSSGEQKRTSWREETRRESSKAPKPRGYSPPKSYPPGTYFSKDGARAAPGPPPGYPTPGSKPYELSTVPTSTVSALSKLASKKTGKKAGKFLEFALDIAGELL